MTTNHCDLRGIIATCKKGNSFREQTVCDFSLPCTTLNKSNDRYCIHLRKSLNDHCDSIRAQRDIKGSDKKEEKAFDVRNPDTYPIYGITY